MSYDLVLKSSKRNWARDEVAFVRVFDQKVITQVAKLVALKTAALKGDKKAKKKWVKVNKKVAVIQKEAAKGNTKAKAQMAAITKTGVFSTPKSKSSGEFIGRDEIVGKDEILGMDEILGEFVGEEELALAAEGGQCERNALRRRFAKPNSKSGFNSHRAFMK